MKKIDFNIGGWTLIAVFFICLTAVDVARIIFVEGKCP